MTTDLVSRPSPTVPAPAVVFRLANPWTARLLLACAGTSAALVGALGAAAVFGGGWLDVVAGVALAGGPLVAGMAVAAGRFWRRAPRSAFVPVARL